MLSDFLPLWQDRGDEKQDTQTFWLSLLNALFPDSPPEIQFEKPVRVDNLKTGVQTTKFIDAYIQETRIVIEQKSRKINLNKPELQSDGSLLTPFQQARRYSGYLPRGEQARYIIVCNFGEFRIHDMNRPNAPRIFSGYPIWKRSPTVCNFSPMPERNISNTRWRSAWRRGSSLGFYTMPSVSSTKIPWESRN